LKKIITGLDSELWLGAKIYERLLGTLVRNPAHATFLTRAVILLLFQTPIAAVEYVSTHRLQLEQRLLFQLSYDANFHLIMKLVNSILIPPDTLKETIIQEAEKKRAVLFFEILASREYTQSLIKEIIRCRELNAESEVYEHISMILIGINRKKWLPGDRVLGILDVNPNLCPVLEEHLQELIESAFNVKDHQVTLIPLLDIVIKILEKRRKVQVDVLRVDIFKVITNLMEKIYYTVNELLQKR